MRKEEETSIVEIKETKLGDANKAKKVKG